MALFWISTDQKRGLLLSIEDRLVCDKVPFMRAGHRSCGSKFLLKNMILFLYGVLRSERSNRVPSLTCINGLCIIVVKSHQIRLTR